MPKKPPVKTQQLPPGWKDPLRPENPLISARWLFWAFGVVIVLAAMCAYATLCLLFYQGQWQMVFHPSRTITATPVNAGLKYEDIHFDYTETGIARLNGWWLSTDPASLYEHDTVLYLHDGRGSLSDYVQQIADLHALGINVFAFDYQGFGKSTGAHPTERQATQDVLAAWSYLTDTRHIASQSIIVYGSGAGASLAAELAAKHASAGLILEEVNQPALEIVKADPRAKLLPLSLLLKEKLDPSASLASLQTPKLFLSRGQAAQRTQQLYQLSAFPKENFDLSHADAKTYAETLRRFFDETLR